MEDKYTFSKDTIPFYPSILSLGAYDGHLVGESASSKHDIVKQYTDIQKAHKMPVNKDGQIWQHFTHKLKIGDVVHIAKIRHLKQMTKLILKNIDETVSENRVNKNGENYPKEERKEANTTYLKKNIPSIENIEQEQNINLLKKQIY